MDRRDRLTILAAGFGASPQVYSPEDALGCALKIEQEIDTICESQPAPAPVYDEDVLRERLDGRILTESQIVAIVADVVKPFDLADLVKYINRMKHTLDDGTDDGDANCLMLENILDHIAAMKEG